MVSWWLITVDNGDWGWLRVNSGLVWFSGLVVHVGSWWSKLVPSLIGTQIHAFHASNKVMIHTAPTTVGMLFFSVTLVCQGILDSHLNLESEAIKYLRKRLLSQTGSGFRKSPKCFGGNHLGNHFSAGQAIGGFLMHGATHETARSCDRLAVA